MLLLYLSLDWEVVSPKGSKVPVARVWFRFGARERVSMACWAERGSQWPVPVQVPVPVVVPLPVPG